MFRAKFQCHAVENQIGQQVVKALPVVGNSVENQSFSRYTPNAKFEMTISNETSAYDQIKPGQEFYMDITPIDIP